MFTDQERTLLLRLLETRLMALDRQRTHGDPAEAERIIGVQESIVALMDKVRHA